jgi:hypothetical protein
MKTAAPVPVRPLAGLRSNQGSANTNTLLPRFESI